MATESELRNQLRGDVTGAPSRIDADLVIRRAKMRRAPRQFAVGSVAVLAVAGFTVLGVSVTPSLFSMSTGAADSAAISGAEPQLGAPESGLIDGANDPNLVDPNSKRTRASQCGEEIVESAPNEWGLELTTQFPSVVAASTQPVSGIVTLTNAGSSRVQGVTSALPTMLLSRDGLTLWRTSGMVTEQARIVDLGPGESLSYTTTFTPAECSQEGDAESQFGDNLPALTPGDVMLSAAILFIPEGDPEGRGVVIAGHPVTVSVR